MLHSATLAQLNTLCQVFIKLIVAAKKRTHLLDVSFFTDMKTFRRSPSAVVADNSPTSDGEWLGLVRHFRQTLDTRAPIH